MLRAFLASMGYAADEAASGQEALALFGRHRYHLVITDLSMPEMNGFELSTAIRRQRPEQPILMVTGFGRFMEAEEARQHADLILGKPFSFEELRGAVERLLDSPRLDSP